LKRATGKAKKEYLQRICSEITELQRTKHYDIMHKKMKELGWEDNHEIQSTGIEDSQVNVIGEQGPV
jgi:hypothetical protein